MWSLLKYLSDSKTYFAETTKRLWSTRSFKGPVLKIKQRDKKYVRGSNYHDFLCRHVELIPECKATAYLFKHSRLNCEYLHVDTNDNQNAFGVSIRTTPLNSKGLAYILEHMVLGKSEKFNAIDPYLNVLCRQSSINFKVKSDCTIYKIQSCSEFEFRNLQDILLDAVFTPSLTYEDFLLKGCRLEFCDSENSSSSIQVNGVVYNKVKGIFASNEAVYERWLLNSILPDHVYAFQSCGHPFEVPNVTYEDLLQFHRKYYHPSNCKFFSTGNLDLEKTLSILGDEYLSKYDFTDPSFSVVPKQKRFPEPVHVQIKSRYDKFGRPFEEQNQISVALLLSEITDVYETFVASILAEILINLPDFYFHKEINTSNIVFGGYNELTGYRPDLRDTLFCVGVQDIKANDFSKFEAVFDNLLKDVITHGFDSVIVSQVTKKLHYTLKHTKGIDLISRILPTWNHDGNILKCMRVENLLKEFWENYQNDPRYLQKKVEKYFVENQHRVTITMSPDRSYEIKFRNTEKTLLNNKILTLSPKERSSIYENGIELENLAKDRSSAKTFCKLAIQTPKIDPYEDYPLHYVDIKTVPMQICELHELEKSIFKCIFRMPQANLSSIQLIPFLCFIFNEKIGDSNITFHPYFAEEPSGLQRFETGIFLRMKLTDEDVSTTFSKCMNILSLDLLEDVGLNAMYKKFISKELYRLIPEGQYFTTLASKGSLTDRSHLKSKLYGVGFFDRIKICNFDDEVQYKIAELRDTIINKNLVRCSLNTPNATRTIKFCEQFLQNLPADEFEPLDIRMENLLPRHQHYIVPIPTAFCAQSYLTVPLTHRYHPALNVLSSLITSRYSTPFMEELCGSSSAGAEIGFDGVLTLHCTHCSNPEKFFGSTKNLKKSVDTSWLYNKDLLYVNQLNVISSLTKRISLENYGDELFLYNLRPEDIVRYNEGVLSVSKEDLDQVAASYIVCDNNPAKCLIGPRDARLTNGCTKWSVRQI